MHKPDGPLNQLNNSQAPWNQFDAEAYNLRHYSMLRAADQKVASRLADALVSTGVAGAGSYIEAGNAGSARLLMVVDPVLSPDATRLLTDVGPRQLAEARKVVDAVNAALAGEASDEQLSLYRRWRAHEDALVFGSPELELPTHARWVGALGRACQRATVEELRIQDLQPDQTDVVGEAHVLCSATTDPEEAAALTAALYESGRLIVRMFDVNSSGYQVGRHNYPGLPITPESVSNEAKRHGLRVVDAFGVEVKDYDHTMSGPNVTASTLQGLGGAVLLRPPTATVIDLAGSRLG